MIVKRVVDKGARRKNDNEKCKLPQKSGEIQANHVSVYHKPSLSLGSMGLTVGFEHPRILVPMHFGICGVLEPIPLGY